MSTLLDRLRRRREAARRHRVIARALRETTSPSVRNEILEIANRYL